MAPTSSILLSNGTVLLHDEKDHVNPTKADVLIVDNKIVEIAPSISPPPDALHIDCTGKILSPGFIDTHHHMWQTQLKGRHADDLLLDYLYNGLELSELVPGCSDNLTVFKTGLIMGSLFKPDDVFWGELGGCMEALDGGVTMVVDHAHINNSAEHCKDGFHCDIVFCSFGY